MLFKQLLLAGALQAALAAAIDVDVNGTPGSHEDRFENHHPKGNRINRTHTDHHHDRVNVDVNHQHDGPTTLNGNVQTRSSTIDINVEDNGQHTEKWKQNHPKGNRFNHTRHHDHNDHVNVNVDHQHENRPTNINANVQTRDDDKDDRVETDGQRGGWHREKSNQWVDSHESDDSDDENNVNLDVNRHGGKTTVGGKVQTRNVDINVNSNGQRTEKFKNDHPKGNRFHDDDNSDSDDEDDLKVDANHQNGRTTVGVQTRNVDVNVDGKPADRFRADHPKGNRFHDDSDSDDEDNVNLDVNHQHNGPTTVGGNIQTRGYDQVNQWDNNKVNARDYLSANLSPKSKPKPDSRLDAWLTSHPSRNRVHDNTKVNVDASHQRQGEKTTVNANVHARGMGNAIFANRCQKDVFIWSVDEGGSSKAIKVAGRTRYTEPFRAPAAGGVVFKVSDTDQIEAGKHTQFEYSISNNQLYYDISFVNCAEGESSKNCPGADKGLAMNSNVGDKCGAIECKPGEYCPKQAYFVDTPLSKLGIAEPVFGCGDAGLGMNLYMIMCNEDPKIGDKRSIAGRIAVEF